MQTQWTARITKVLKPLGGGFAAVGLRMLGVFVLVASLIVSGLMAWTANLGGQIRHTEIRADNSPAAVTGAKHHD